VPFAQDKSPAAKHFFASARGFSHLRGNASPFGKSIEVSNRFQEVYRKCPFPRLPRAVSKKSPDCSNGRRIPGRQQRPLQPQLRPAVEDKEIGGYVHRCCAKSCSRFQWVRMAEKRGCV
jgi:hypothetical protein